MRGIRQCLAIVLGGALSVLCLAASARAAGEAAAVSTTGATAAAAAPAAVRPQDAKAFGGHWYKVFEEDLTWHEKKRRCEELGGYLACIETAKEQAFIAELADGRYLSLGATDEVEEGTWVWVNGAAWDYTCWMDGQPNNWGDDEHYLATYDGGDWVDVATDGGGFWMPTGFICEWEK